MKKTLKSSLSITSRNEPSTSSPPKSPSKSPTRLWFQERDKSRASSESDTFPTLEETKSQIQLRNSLGKSRRKSYTPGKHINPTGYELDSELEVADLNIGFSQAEFDKYNVILSSNEIKDLGMSTIEIEAQKRGQRWRNLSYIHFKTYHNISVSELHDW